MAKLRNLGRWQEILDGWSTQAELLRLFVEAFVPSMIHDIEKQGGLTSWHLERMQILGDKIAAQGDVILYRGERKGSSAQSVSLLLEALSIAAFFPGGITFAGVHFESRER